MKYPITLILVFSFLGCTRGQISVNQVYVLALEFWDCEATPQGDCDSGDLIFLPNRHFALVDRCISGDIYLTGTYLINKSQLTLRFDKKRVVEIQDVDYNVTGYSDKEIEVIPVVFEIKDCKNSVHLVNTKTDSVWMNGSRYEAKKENEMLTEVLESKPWKQLTK